jgi:transposase
MVESLAIARSARPRRAMEALDWATRWPERTWAIEECRHSSRNLERDLIRAEERLVRVPPRLMGATRSVSRKPGKSDPIDALAVARTALREPDLPIAQLDGPDREVRLLVDHREDLVVERTRIENRLRWHLHELTPGEAPRSRSLDRRGAMDALEQRLQDVSGTVARLAVSCSAAFAS